MPLQGNLKDMSLANLIQVNCQEMRTARLLLTYQGQTADIFFSDGQIVHAENGAQRGEQVIYEALAWDDGTFSLDMDVPSPGKTIHTPWSALLLEGMKHVTELRPPQIASKSKTNPDLKRLKAIDGVTGVVIASSDGIVQSWDIPDSDGEGEAAVAIFIGGAARQMSEVMQLGKFQHGVVFWQNRRVLVLETSDRYFGLVLNEHGSPALVANAAMKILNA